MATNRIVNKTLDRIQDFLMDIAESEDTDITGSYYTFRRLTDRFLDLSGSIHRNPSVDRKLVLSAFGDISRGRTFNVPMPRVHGARKWTDSEALALAYADSLDLVCGWEVEDEDIKDAVEDMVKDLVDWMAERAEQDM